jgi:hypothetical protein
MNLKRGYQHRSNLVKDENGDLLAESNTILNRRKSCFSHLLNVYYICEIKQIETYTAGPLVPGLSHIDFHISIAKLENYKSPGSD